MEVSIGNFFISFKSLDNPIFKEIEIGLDDKFNIEYFHIWYDTQIHCLSLGNIYISWKGLPLIDSK